MVARTERLTLDLPDAERCEGKRWQGKKGAAWSLASGAHLEIVGAGFWCRPAFGRDGDGGRCVLVAGLRVLVVVVVLKVTAKAQHLVVDDNWRLAGLQELREAVLHVEGAGGGVVERVDQEEGQVEIAEIALLQVDKGGGVGLDGEGEGGGRMRGWEEKGVRSGPTSIFCSRL